MPICAKVLTGFVPRPAGELRTDVLRAVAADVIVSEPRLALEYVSIASVIDAQELTILPPPTAAMLGTLNGTDGVVRARIHVDMHMCM